MKEREQTKIGKINTRDVTIAALGPKVPFLFDLATKTGFHNMERQNLESKRKR